MTTLISYDTAPECVRELVRTYRYLRHRVEASIALLTKHKNLVKHDRTLDGLHYQDTYDLIVLLEDFLDRMQRLERATFPEEFSTKKQASQTHREPSSIALDETSPETGI